MGISIKGNKSVDNFSNFGRERRKNRVPFALYHPHPNTVTQNSTVNCLFIIYLYSN